MYFSLDQFMFMLPALALALAATIYTKFMFGRYSRVAASSGLTGAEAAAHMLAAEGIREVRIEPTSGFLSDHYDPTSKTLRLSPAVYGSNSLAAVGVACHEAGHALQHATGYVPLALRTGMVPVTQIGSHAAYWLLLLGLMMGSLALVKVGILLFSVAVLFALVTLPVEWNATARAKTAMAACGIVGPGEERMAGQVLNAAFLTYVAAAVTAIMQLLYFLLRAGLLGGRRDD